MSNNLERINKSITEIENYLLYLESSINEAQSILDKLRKIQKAYDSSDIDAYSEEHKAIMDDYVNLKYTPAFLDVLDGIQVNSLRKRAN